MQSYALESPDLSQVQSAMAVVEQACNSIQMHMNPAEAEATILAFRQSSRPYQTCRYILENSHLANARFQAAATIQDAAVREWGFLPDEEKQSLISFCLSFVMEHAHASEAYVQTKLSAVGALLMKRGWLESTAAEKDAFFIQVRQSVVGAHGRHAQFVGINFLESLVSEFSPSTATGMGLPVEFHEKCRASLETKHLKDFYCWAQDAVLSVANEIGYCDSTGPEVKVCAAAMRLMSQILNWEFKKTITADVGGVKNRRDASFSGFGHEAALFKKSELVLVQPGPAWRDVLLSHGRIGWVLELYRTIGQKSSSDRSWIDSPLAVSARQLIVQFCSLTGTIFPSDDGQMQEQHMLLLLAGIIQWIDPPDTILNAITYGKSESEMLDGCRGLLAMASLTTPSLFDRLLKSVRPFGTLSLLSLLTCEVMKAHAANKDEEETWASEAINILLDTWNVLLQVLEH